jgi:hypothetical protein
MKKMSLNKKVVQLLDEVRDKFIKAVADAYNLNPAEISQLWDSDQKAPSKLKTAPVPTPKTEDVVLENVSPELLKMSRAELVTLCKEKGLRHSGTKAKLISILSGSESEKKVTEVSTSKPKKTTAKEPAVAKKLAATVQPISIRRNEHGNHEHNETHLVFDKKTMKAIGHQESNGKVAPLNEEDVENCNKFNFPYDLPDNLDKGTVNDADVKELDEDEDEDEGDLEEDGMILDEEEEEYVEEEEEEEFEEEEEEEEEFEEDD